MPSRTPGGRSSPPGRRHLVPGGDVRNHPFGRNWRFPLTLASVTPGEPGPVPDESGAARRKGVLGFLWFCFGA